MGEYVPTSFRPTDPAGECDCCGYGPTAVVHVPGDLAGYKPEADMCEVCYRTRVGVWARHRDVHDPVKVELGQLIAWGINYLRDARGPG